MPFAFRPQRRSGLTLVEILIALTMTLVVLGTMTAAFKVASEEMREGRALIELANRARIVEDHLRTDLGSITVETRVYDGEVEPHGYFEYVEGPNRDSTFAESDSFQGDCDDVLAFTARSTDGILYRGRRTRAVIPNGGSVADLELEPPVVIESSLAEIVWFTTVNDNDDVGGPGPLQAQGIDGTVPAGAPVTSSADFDDSIRLHRRVLLIRPDLGRLAIGVSIGQANNIIRNNDISVRVVPTNASATRFSIIANSLEDLAIRANRFAHMSTTFNGTGEGNFPNNLLFGDIQNRVASDDDNIAMYSGAATPWRVSPPILSDIGAFDLRAYSPTARVGERVAVIVEPSDVGYARVPLDLSASGSGAYVDLGYGFTLNLPIPIPAPTPDQLDEEWFIANSAAPNNAVAWSTGVNVWDTWTPAYESDGIDQDSFNGVDQSTNGTQDLISENPDDPGSNVIDDPGERETQPPYVEPIRGMKITLRLVEKGTKQVHQVSVIHSFVPE